jgi:CRISPR-associated protein Cas2
MFWLACYDVCDEKRLRRVAGVMERYGARVQKSVFECWLTDRVLARMKEEVRQEMDAQEDSLRLYSLCEVCRERSENEGDTPIQRIQTAYII